MLSLRDRSSLVAVFSALSLWIGAVERAMAVGVWAGKLHTVALKSNGTVWAWGENGSGQLGLGDIVNRYIPVVVPMTLPSGVVVTDIAVGGEHTLALLQDGTVLAWGKNNARQLGGGTCVTTNSTSPTQV